MLYQGERVIQLTALGSGSPRWGDLILLATSKGLQAASHHGGLPHGRNIREVTGGDGKEESMEA